jgi:Leucine-rich repeat (LRR) protein
MPVAPLQDFQRLMEKSNLLSAEQWVELRAWPEEEPATLVARMLKAGWITGWQSQQLMLGKSQFFMGRYKLLELVGQGGMGAVYKAMLPPYGRTVALKVMNKNLLKQPKSVTRFLREIRSAAAVDHPNLVRAYDADCDRDTYFLVMEFVTGQNLKSWIKSEQALPVGWSCECIRQAALGLEHAFEQGMVHRDIKPSNLVVTEDEHDGLPLVKILDLGLARFASETEDSGDLTRSGQVLGTPDYIAPEQARSTRTADIRADIFSLGCTLFELLTGRLPFTGTTVMEKLMARASQDAFRVRQFRPDVPVALDEIVARMLARDPQWRFTTPAEVARALAPFSIGTAGDVPVPAAASSQADVTTAAPPAITFASLDITADTPLHGFPAELTEAAPARRAPLARARIRGPLRDSRTRIAAAVVGAMVLLGLVWAALAGKRGSSDNGAARQEHASKKHRAGADEENDEIGADRSADDESDPERAAAAWVLERRGTLTVVARGTHPPRGRSGKAHQLTGGRREVRDAAELPDGSIEITGVELHSGNPLSRLDFDRLAKLRHLETLNLADTRFDDADLAELQDAESLAHLDLQNTPLSDAGVVLLKKISRLQSLQVSRTRISGDALAILKSLHNLTDLQVEGTPIRDGHLIHLRDMPHLKVLSLARTEVRGAFDRTARGPAMSSVWQLKELATLDLSGLHLQPVALAIPRGAAAELRSLRLSGAKVTDDGLKQLSGMTSLHELYLDSTQVTSEGLKHLTWMAELERLELGDTIVGNAGLKVVGGLASLKSLGLQGTAVGDAGLDALVGLKGLETLDLSGSKVTATGADALRKQLPNCKIAY